MRIRSTAGALLAVTLLALSAGPAAAAPNRVATLAQQQTKIMLKHYEGQNVSPPTCGQGQSPNGDHGVLLLPVLSFGSGDATLNCRTTARSVLVDLGGFVVTEDNRFPDSSYELNGQLVPFTRRNLEPICDDVIAQGFLGDPQPGTLDGQPIAVGPAIDSGVFTSPINRHAQVPGGADMYADSVSLGHPGRLATVFCGYKAKVHLSPGRHTIVVDYSGLVGSPTVFTFTIRVTA